MIDAVRVAVDANTVIDEHCAPAEIGALVDVKALRQEDGSLLAIKITVKDSQRMPMNTMQFEGQIQAMNQAMWMIGGRQIVIDDDTTIDESNGRAVVGARVSVRATRELDRKLHARSITVLAQTPQTLAAVSWTGTLEAMNAATWRIAGREVVVDARTRLVRSNGPLMVNATVHVDALQQSDGTLWARRIESRGPQLPAADVQFSGNIESMTDESWMIAGVAVMVDASTIIDEREGPAEVGAMVSVRAMRQEDGSLYAQRIHVQNDLPDGFKIEFRGPIEAMDEAQWRVAGFDVVVDDATRFMHLERAELGAIAQVSARRMDDGSLLAIEINIRGTAADQLRQVEWKGPLERFDDGQWQVAGLTAIIDENTLIYGEPLLNATVEVHAWVQDDGSFLAYKLLVEPDARMSFHGVVEAISSEAWTIGGVRFKVDTRTIFDEDNGPLGVGVTASVKAMRLDDGSFLAMRIETVN